jgi:hypothetical protein
MTNQTPTRPDNRDKIYDVIDGEREYQEKHFPDSPKPTEIQFADLLDEYAIKFGNAFAPSPALGKSACARLQPSPCMGWKCSAPYRARTTYPQAPGSLAP